MGGDATEAEGQIVNLALAHHLVSDYTSLVAVDVTPVRPVDAVLTSEQAPTSAPRGGAWAPSSTGFAPTATPAPLLMMLGLLACAVALMLTLSPARFVRRVDSFAPRPACSTRGSVRESEASHRDGLRADGRRLHGRRGLDPRESLRSSSAYQLGVGSSRENGAKDARPWPWADTTPVARLTFHDWKTLVVLEGSSGRNLAFAPSHDAASVQPGEPGNSIISAHRDTHFRQLEHARLGDRIQVERPDGKILLFTVTDVRVVDSRHTRLALNGDEPRLTLVTCYPFDAIRPGGPLRWVVTADEAVTEEEGIRVAGYDAAARISRGGASPTCAFIGPLTGP